MSAKSLQYLPNSTNLMSIRPFVVVFVKTPEVSKTNPCPSPNPSPSSKWVKNQQLSLSEVIRNFKS